MTDALNLVPWTRLSPARQGALCGDFLTCGPAEDGATVADHGRTPDHPAEQRLTQFSIWLAARGVAVSDTDLRRIRWADHGDTGISREAMG